MVKYYTRYITLIFLLCLPFAVYSTPSAELQLTVSNNKSELGKPVKLILTSNQTRVSLDSIDLSALKTDFHINDSSETIISNEHQEKKLILYPRKTGELSISGIHFINSTTKPVTISVTPAFDRKTSTIINVQPRISTVTPWEKQQILITLTFLTKSSIVVFNTPKPDLAHSDIIPLHVTSSPVIHQQEKWTRHITGWKIYPQQAGNLTLTLPPVHFIRDGVTTHRFYPPVVNLTVKKLPVYIPATMPIGKLDLQVIKKPTSPIFPGKIGDFRFKVSGTQVNSLLALDNQLKSSEAISIYPPKITTRQSGTLSEAIYTVNFKANQQGLHDFEEINLKYFDPDSGTIKSLSKSIGTVFGLHLWVVVILVILLLSIVSWLIHQTWKWVIQVKQRYENYKSALQQIQAAHNPRVFKNALQKIAAAESWPENITLRQWHSLSQSTASKVELQQLIKLECALYHGKNESFDQLKGELINFCYQRNKILHWLIVNQVNP